jgi:hypothetical protein
VDSCWEMARWASFRKTVAALFAHRGGPVESLHEADCCCYTACISLMGKKTFDPVHVKASRQMHVSRTVCLSILQVCGLNEVLSTDFFPDASRCLLLSLSISLFCSVDMCFRSPVSAGM